MSPHIHLDRKQIASLCRKYHVQRMALFGSVLTDDFGPDSDVDVLVEFEPEARPSLFDVAELGEDLREVVGRDVDLVEKAGLRNPFRRRRILDTAEEVYAAP